jgi:hypothetical protein
MGRCVVVVEAEFGMIAAAYNEDGFTSVDSESPNLNGFIASVHEDGGCGEIFHRNDHEIEVVNQKWLNPCFGSVDKFDLFIPGSFHENISRSSLGASYGTRGPGVNGLTLFGERRFWVIGFEMFKVLVNSPDIRFPLYNLY